MVSTSKSKKKIKGTKDLLGQLDVLFVIDATGSMEQYISEARKYAGEVAVKLAKDNDLDIRFGVVAYRDHPPQDSTFVTTKSDGFGDVSRLQDALRRLHAGGGGDRPEAVWDGVSVASWFDWREGADRTIYLIGDSPPHGLAGNQHEDFWPKGCPCGLTADELIVVLRDKKIELNAFSISGHSDTTAAFELLTKPTGGVCIKADRPEVMTTGYITSLGDKSESITTSRAVFDAMSTTGLSYRPAAASLGLSVEDIDKTAEYLARRGIKTDE